MSAVVHDMKDTTEVTTKRVSERARVAEAVSRCVAEKVHGDAITKAELLVWLALTYPQVGTRKEFAKAELLFARMKAKFDDAMLVQHKMALQSERGEVWRIVLPSEQSDFAVKAARTAFTRGLKKAQSLTANVDVSGLTDAARAKLDDTSARLAAIQMFAAKNIPRRLPDGGGR